MPAGEREARDRWRAGRLLARMRRGCRRSRLRLPAPPPAAPSAALAARAPLLVLGQLARVPVALQPALVHVPALAPGRRAQAEEVQRVGEVLAAQEQLAARALGRGLGEALLQRDDALRALHGAARQARGRGQGLD